jgi:hypothetical protein
MKVIIDGHDVLLDEEDAHLLTDGRAWRISFGTKRYVRWQTNSDGKKVIVFLHRLVCGAKDDQLVDHINGNSLDNRKANLRIADSRQNARNQGKRSQSSASRFKGVSAEGNGWRARIRTDFGPLYLGKFDDEVAAAFAYDCASLEHHGEYGRRNFLPLA